MKTTTLQRDASAAERKVSASVHRASTDDKDLKDRKPAVLTQQLPDSTSNPSDSKQTSKRPARVRPTKAAPIKTKMRRDHPVTRRPSWLIIFANKPFRW